jgi:hypothetical protein
MTGRRRSELEIFNALATEENPADLAELSERIRRCIHWVLSHRMSGGHAVGGEGDEITGVVLERLGRLRVRGFAGGAAQFKAYLYRTVATACLAAAHRQRLVESLDAPMTLPDGEQKPLSEVLREMVDPIS